MSALLLAAAAAAAYAALMGQSAKPSAPQGPETPKPPTGGGMIPIPGGGMIPIPEIPIPQIPIPSWPSMPTSPGASIPAPQQPPPVQPPSAPTKAVLTPWAPADFIRRPIGKNIGALTPSGAAKLRQRLSWCYQWGAVEKDRGWAKVEYVFPLAQPNSLFPSESALAKIEGLLRKYPQSLVAFLPTPPALRVDPNPRKTAEDLGYSTVSMPMGAEIQEMFLIQPVEKDFLDDPLAAIGSLFTGDPNKAYPVNLEGLVVVNYAEGMANGLFRGEY
jgi:hypothetical protein